MSYLGQTIEEMHLLFKVTAFNERERGETIALVTKIVDMLSGRF